MSFSKIILSPFVWLLTAFYNLTGSYGLALILFAVVVKLILFPFSLKGKRSMIQMNMLNAKLQKIQRQCGKDRDRYNAEVSKLYEREHVNPMGGCLWSFIPLFILLPLYAIIRRPLFYTMGLTMDQMQQVAQALDWNNIAMNMGWIKTVGDGVFTSAGYNELYLASLINGDNINSLISMLGEGAHVMALNFNFLGVDLSQVPHLKFWLISGGLGLFILPLISAVTGLLFSVITMKTNAINQQSAEAATASTNRVMMIMTPLMSLWIGFNMPAALCIYWIANNVLSMVQEYVSGKMLKKDYEKAAAAQEEQLRLEKEEEKAEKRRKAEERARRAEEERHNKLAKKKAMKEDPNYIPGEVKEASRVGIRQYARGRAYNPERYGAGPTPYTEYVDPERIALEAEKEKRARKAAEKNSKKGKKEKSDKKDSGKTE